MKRPGTPLPHVMMVSLQRDHRGGKFGAGNKNRTHYLKKRKETKSIFLRSCFEVLTTALPLPAAHALRPETKVTIYNFLIVFVSLTLTCTKLLQEAYIISDSYT